MKNMKKLMPIFLEKRLTFNVENSGGGYENLIPNQSKFEKDKSSPLQRERTGSAQRKNLKKSLDTIVKKVPIRYEEKARSLIFSSLGGNPENKKNKVDDIFKLSSYIDMIKDGDNQVYENEEINEYLKVLEILIIEELDTAADSDAKKEKNNRIGGVDKNGEKKHGWIEKYKKKYPESVLKKINKLGDIFDKTGISLERNLKTFEENITKINIPENMKHLSVTLFSIMLNELSDGAKDLEEYSSNEFVQNQVLGNKTILFKDSLLPATEQYLYFQKKENRDALQKKDPHLFKYVKRQVKKFNDEVVFSQKPLIDIKVPSGIYGNENWWRGLEKIATYITEGGGSVDFMKDRDVDFSKGATVESRDGKGVSLLEKTKEFKEVSFLNPELEKEEKESQKYYLAMIAVSCLPAVGDYIDAEQIFSGSDVMADQLAKWGMVHPRYRQKVETWEQVLSGVGIAATILTYGAGGIAVRTLKNIEKLQNVDKNELKIAMNEILGKMGLKKDLSTKKNKNIMPKKERIGHNKTEDLIRNKEGGKKSLEKIQDENSKLQDSERIDKAQKYLGRNLTADQKEALLKAHNIETGKNTQKGKILRDAGFTPDETKIIMRSKLAGVYKATPEMSSIPRTKTLDIVGDLHGNFDIYKANLSSLGVIDKQGNWIGGDKKLVFLGDILADRNNQSIPILLDIEKLKEQGANISVIAGNHEDFAISFLMNKEVASGGSGKEISFLGADINNQNRKGIDKIRGSQGFGISEFLKYINKSEIKDLNNTNGEILLAMQKSKEGRKILESICNMKLIESLDDSFMTHTPMTNGMGTLLLNYSPEEINTIYQKGLRDSLLGNGSPDKEFFMIRNAFLHTGNRKKEIMDENIAARVKEKYNINRIVHGHDSNEYQVNVGGIQSHSIDFSAGKRGGDDGERSIGSIKKETGDLQTGKDVVPDLPDKHSRSPYKKTEKKGVLRSIKDVFKSEKLNILDQKSEVNAGKVENISKPKYEGRVTIPRTEGGTSQAKITAYDGKENYIVQWTEGGRTFKKNVSQVDLDALN